MNSHAADNTADNIIVDISHLTVRRDSRLILDDIDLTVERGDFIAITGPNGGGKTTLLRVILGLLRPSSGTVWVRGDIPVGYLPQKNTIDSHFPISVREVVASGLLSSRIAEKSRRNALVDEALAAVGVEELESRPIGTLSGGQLQRALLARAIISRPQLLVLDEPLSYIDKRFEERLYDLVAGLASSATILLVSHELSGITHMATRTITIDKHIIG